VVVSISLLWRCEQTKVPSVIAVLTYLRARSRGLSGHHPGTEQRLEVVPALHTPWLADATVGCVGEDIPGGAREGRRAGYETESASRQQIIFMVNPASACDLRGRT
jgi:hypothetical protein